MHCTNIYPTPPKLVRLNCIHELKNFKDAVVGLSDHTTSNFTSYGALALGAKIIEKHYVDDKLRKGPDISCSMDPNDLKDLTVEAKIYLKQYIQEKELLKKKQKRSNLHLHQ